MTSEFVIRRSTIRAVVAALAGVLAALGSAELGARVWEWVRPAQTGPNSISFGSARQAHCYSRAPGVSFPIDLAREADRSLLLGALDPGEKATALTALEQRTPLCVVYDMRPESRRFLISAPGYRETVALLGDSFAFGAGVDESVTIGARLSKTLQWRIRSYAFPGADLPEIVDQFQHAIDQRKRFGISKILYFYVPNDPFRTPELTRRLSRLSEHVEPIRSPAVPTFGSALLRILFLRFWSRLGSKEMIEWYRDLHDPAINPELAASFRQLGQMTRQARSMGIEFIVLVYPLMLDMDPYPLAGAHATLRALAAESGVELHDMLPAFERNGRGASLYVHPYDYHPNAFAQSIAADDAAEYLRQRGHP